MGTLVQFLASGVNGAASGTATFLLRGTASSAAAVLYNDFEGTTQPGTNVIALDANGAAEVYCDAYVDVQLRSSAGSLLRTVTVGNSAPVVEVQSASFTGTDYDGSPANTAEEPVTLKDVLDRWITSAGTTDFRVLIDGVATNLDAALSGFSGLFVNVKDPTYGALGDGVTDDTTAILAANIAAAGGILFFPPGTYKVTTLGVSSSNLNWYGAGRGVSIISGSTSTSLVGLTNNTNTAWKNFSNLSFTSSGGYTRLFNLEENQNVSFKNCSFDASQCSGAGVEWTSAVGLSKVFFTDCDFVFGSATNAGLRNAAETGDRDILIKGCHFTVPSGFTGDIIEGADFTIDGSVFDAFSVTAGTYRHIDASSVATPGCYVGNFTNCRFIDGGSDGFVFKLTGMDADGAFSESGNTFVGFVAPAATLEKGHIYEITDAESGNPGQIHLGSRKGRSVFISASADIVASACLEAENVVIEMEPNTNISVTVPALIPGLAGRVMAFRTGPSADTQVDFEDSAGFGVRFVFNAVNDNIVAAGATDELCSCSYFTTLRATGAFRSIITSEVEHHA